MLDNRDLIVIAICTRDRPTQLERVLRELARLPVPPRVGARVQIIDNSLAGNAREVVQRVGQTLGDIGYCHEPDGGIPGARNAAIRERKRSEHLVFIDDDEWPDQSWLLHLWRGHEMDPSAIIGGRTDRVKDVDWRNLEQGVAIELQNVDACGFGNVLLPADLLDKDELTFSARYRGSGGEDLDFCFRAASLGVGTRLAPAAVCFELLGKERRRVRYRMKMCFTTGAIYSDVLRRHKRRSLLYRVVAIIARFMVGLCVLPIAVIQDGNRYRGIEDISFALGGFVGLFGYLPHRYP